MSDSLLEEWGVFSDELFSATDLNRKSGDVLNAARKRPVTISRNNEQFALLPREKMGGLVHGFSVLKQAVELLGAAWRAAQDADVPPAFTWLRAFDADDLNTMGREITDACTAAIATNDWYAVRYLVMQWHRSAIVILDGTLSQALAETKEEVPLTKPDPGSDSGDVTAA